MNTADIHVGNFIHEIRPLYCVVKAIGLAPYSLQVNPVTHEEAIDIKFASNVGAVTASGVALISLLAGFMYCTLWMEFSLFKNPGNTLCTSISVPINFISAIILVIMTLTVNRHPAQELFRKFSSIDESLCRVRRGCESHRKKSHVQLYVPLMALMVTFMCYDIYVWSKSLDTTFCIAKRYAHCVTLAAIILYCKLVWMIRSRLCDIRDILSSTLSDRLTQTDMSYVLRIEGPSDSKKECNVASRIMHVASVDILNSPVTLNRVAANLDVQPFAETHTILSLRRVYNQVHECTGILNFMFGFPLLLDIVRTVTALISDLYLILRLFIEPVEEVTALSFSDFLISLSTWLVIFLATITAVTVICGRTASTAKDIAHEVQTFLLDSPVKSDEAEQLRLFSQQISTDAIVLTAAGFFSIDLSMLCTVLTSAITYVIILIQFKSN
jgi:hypothetical protein